MKAMLLLALLAQQPDTATLELFRYWRGADETAVVGIVAVPLSQLTFIADTAPGVQAAAYTMRVAFRDSAGTVLNEQSWTQRVTRREQEAAPSARAFEQLSVNLKPGRYTIDVQVRDSVGRRDFALRRDVIAPRTAPAIGDLMVAHELRRAMENETPPAGTIGLNGLIIAPNVTGRAVTGAPVVLYTEVYPGARAGDTATVSVVLERDGTPFRQQVTVGRRVYQPAGGIETLRLPLQGLAAGEYTVGVQVAWDDTTFGVEHPVTIIEPELAEAAPDLFDGYSVAQLDSLFAAATYIATQEENRIYPTLSPEGKRRFMNRFWARRDPTPGLPNEFYDEYRQRIAFANANFRVRGGTPGWATARGRVYVVNGPPGERYTQPVVGREGGDRPFEIWKYAGGRQPKYVFLDIGGFGNYQLVYSSDPNEPTMPNWRSYFDAESLALIDRF